MKTKIVSFGDSFIFGSELEDNRDGSKAWPGLAAVQLEVDYETRAIPGCGNENIARQVLDYFHNNSKHDVLAIINWTWAIRWDFYLTQNESWVTLGPTCVPQKLDQVLGWSEAERVIKFYNDYPGHSTIWDRYRTLQPIYAVQQYLKANNITAIQTYMDYDIFDREFHAPGYIQELQDLTQVDMLDFEGQNFLDWSRSRGFKVTEPGWHPLRLAHEAACKLWQDTYAQALNR